MRYFYVILILIGVAVISIAGLRGSFSRRPPIEIFSDMVRQPKVRPESIDSRTNMAGTVERNQPVEDLPINTGRITGTTNWVLTNPVPITKAVMDRGQERFDIMCAPCHGAAGDSRGITMKYNMVAMANFHDKRIIDMADGEIFNTITHGKTLMGAYGAGLSVEDRWAVIAYIRALERSHLSTIDDVPKELWGMFGK